MTKATKCSSCGEVKPCESYHVESWSDETLMQVKHVEWRGWLCDGCEDKLLALLDGMAEGGAEREVATGESGVRA